MKRILAIDYGLKRCGMAISGPLRISINPLDTVSTDDVVDKILNVFSEYEIEMVLFGESRHKDGTPTKHMTNVKKLIDILRKKVKQEFKIAYVDESFTSFEAKSLMFEQGVKKKKRREKQMVDKVSAVLILKRYLDSVNY